MNENDKSRSGLQTAVDFAHAARAAKRIMQAAAVSGVHGAAAATAREAFPLLLKILIAALVVFIVVPMVIFTALPNIFFGYNSSGTDTVIQMTQQAMTLGGVYMTLGNFEGAQIDSVVTGIAAEYEKNGTTIDHNLPYTAETEGLCEGCGTYTKFYFSPSGTDINVSGTISSAGDQNDKSRNAKIYLYEVGNSTAVDSYTVSQFTGSTSINTTFSNLSTNKNYYFEFRNTTSHNIFVNRWINFSLELS